MEREKPSQRSAGSRAAMVQESGPSEIWWTITDLKEGRPAEGDCLGFPSNAVEPQSLPRITALLFGRRVRQQCQRLLVAWPSESGHGERRHRSVSGLV